MTDGARQASQTTLSPAGKAEARAARIEAALDWARAMVGVREDSPGSNRGPEIDEWQRACGLVGQAWCGAFAAAALRVGGVDVPREIVWTPFILEWARDQSNGFSLHDWAEREPGDLVLFAFEAGGDEVQHVGLLDLDRRHTIEGNTSSGPGGSQVRGGTVARRDRCGAGVVGCARPPWR
jgi:hypothetical protein